ncbi:MAG: type IIL restriction-modification enzyme MmeI, partial [Pseudanabaena sp.]
DIRAQVDFASYWFRLAHERLDENGRAGLVATNSISQGKSRSVSLEYIVENGGYIYDAIPSQVWSGEAAVYVSIINWSKKEPLTYILDNEKVSIINSSLQSSIDVSNVAKIKANLNTGFVGAQPNSKGFFISEQQAKDWIKADPKNKFVVKPSCSATDLTDNPNGLPSRWIIDFQDMTFEEVTDYRLPFEHTKTFVKPERINNREAVLRDKWWRFKRTNDSMRKALANLPLYFIVPRHSKWFIFLPVQSDWLPADSTTVIASDDFYVLGILTSKVHRLWVKVQISTLGETPRYTHNTCFETFPFPQLDPKTSTKAKQTIEKIRAIMQDLHQYRSQQMESKQWGITKLYNEYFHERANELHKLHTKLDKLVLQAYGFSEDDDILSKLLELNLQLEEREKQGLPVIGARQKS